MKVLSFTITEDYIELIALLKYMGVAQTGGHAKMLVDEGLVKVNEQAENRKRYKVRKGDTILVNEEVQIIVN